MMAQAATPAATPKTMPTLGQWIKRVAELEMPIFGRTLESVLSVAHNEDSTVSELARVVLQDSAMTARVLKLVNSSLYNPTSEPISTISRAILMLGFDNARDWSLSVALIDSFVKGPQRTKLDEEMARFSSHLWSSTTRASVCSMPTVWRAAATSTTRRSAASPTSQRRPTRGLGYIVSQRSTSAGG